jgi:peptidoglycan L-alanyl-D-glutamate endopeptidase CwlK
LRSAEDQAKLFTAGKSKADGRTNHSYHQTGKAVDVYAYVDGKASWEKEHLAIIAAAMLQASAQLGYELKWGGLWKSWQDFPHFEIRD